MNRIAILTTSIAFILCILIIIVLYYFPKRQQRKVQPDHIIISSIIDFDENIYVLDMRYRDDYIDQLNYFIDNHVKPDFDISPVIEGLKSNQPWVLFTYPHFLPQVGYRSIDELQSNAPVELADLLLTKLNRNEKINDILIYCSNVSNYIPFQGWSVNNKNEDTLVAAKLDFKNKQQMKCECSLWSPNSAGEYKAYLEIIS